MGELKLKSEIVRNSQEDYHASPRLGSTVAKMMLRSPLHARFYLENPPPATPAQTVGMAAHYALLQPDLFERHVAVEPRGINRRTRLGKETYEAFLLENDGKIVISPEQNRSIRSMMGAVYRHPIAKRLLNNGHPEMSYYWTDSKSGVECKCRPDFLRDGHILVDIKTCEDASFYNFQRSITNYKYHLQAAWYLEGVSRVTDHLYDTFIIVAVEKSPPYAVAVYALDGATLEIGEFLMRKALSLYSKCQKNDHWPGYDLEIQPMNLTPWGFKEGEIYEYSSDVT